MTMLELCMECRNFHNPEIIPGTFTVTDGVLQPLPAVPDGAWIRIVGSTFNDGCWQYPHGDFADEVFTGAVWILHIPPDFVALQRDIDAWERDSAAALASASAEVLSGPYSSESFAGYTYQRKTGVGDVPTTWRDPRLPFAARINRWRKI
jgi:hypothetical protein